MTAFQHCLLLLFLCSPLGYASITSHSNKLSVKHLYKNYLDNGVCLQGAVCTPVQNLSCFGTVLPYTSTSIALAEDSASLFEVQKNLALWQGLRKVPRCWAAIQPLLCGIYLPKCENGSVFLPTQEMCRITREPCKTVELYRGWPSFLRCEDKKLFPPHCRNPLQEIKFNTSATCISPLIETEITDHFYNAVKGCGIQCQNPFFTKEEHDSTHNLILILASVCFILTLFSVMTFLVSWKAANRYPGVIIFYINICLAIVSFGWLIQFFPGAREEIVCAYDGTIRRNQPRSGEHLCSITFVLVYSFLIAAIVWLVILTYAWYVLFKQTGTPQDIVKKIFYFHLAAWGIPLVLTTVVMAIKEVDGDSMSGICFVGYNNITMRMIFLLGPISLAVLVGGYFLTCVLYTLIKVKLKSQEVTNVHVKTKIHRMMLKIGVFSTCTVVLVICTFACHAYDFSNWKNWEENLFEYIVCLSLNSANSYSNYGEIPRCHFKSKPSIGVVRIHHFCLFGFGIIMALWVWTRESIESWKHFLYRLCEPAEKNSVAIKRHQLIAKAFQRRHEINQGQIIQCADQWISTHDDPFDMSRHISMDSFNQPNTDSLSMQISEQEFVAHTLKEKRRKTRKERKRFLRANRIAPWFPGNRRGSDSSLQSSLKAVCIAAAAKKSAVDSKATKATSTGDLHIIPLPQPMPFPPPVMMPPVNNRPHIQRPAVNPPFTHGITDNSHCLDNRLPSVASVIPRTASSQRFTPSIHPSTVLPNSLMGMVRHPVYGGSYDVLNSVPFGYLGGGMYLPMNGMYPQYPFNPEYIYNACNSQYQQDILPMHPMIDSASDTEFFPYQNI